MAIVEQSFGVSPLPAVSPDFTEEEDPFVLPGWLYRCRMVLQSGLFAGPPSFRMVDGCTHWTAVRRHSMYELRNSAMRTPMGYLRPANRNWSFALRERRDGRDTMVFSFLKARGAPVAVRAMTVVLNGKAIATALPHLDAGGAWTLDLGTGNCIPSKMNCTLETEDRAPVIYIRKCARLRIEIESNDPEFAPIHLFALCIGSFLAPE
jgi:hypothetical protein